MINGKIDTTEPMFRTNAEALAWYQSKKMEVALYLDHLNDKIDVIKSMHGL